MGLINGHKIYFVDEGNEVEIPVIFLHGFPLSHEMWKPQIKFLSEKYYVIAYDILGHGKSDVGDGQYTIDHHVDDLFALMDLLKIKKAVLVGLSMGGYIALRAYERRPLRIRALVLSDTKSEADTDEGKIKRFAGMRDVKENGSAVYAETAVKTLFASKTFKKNPEMVQDIEKIVANTKPLGIAGTLLALAARSDTTPILSQIKVPVLILVGSEDVITPPRLARAMHKKIPHSELHIIPEAGHMSNLENPEAFNRHLLSFLEKL